MSWTPDPALKPTASDTVASRIIYAVLLAIGSMAVVDGLVNVGVADAMHLGLDSDDESVTQRILTGVETGFVVELVAAPDESTLAETDGAQKSNVNDDFDLDLGVQVHLPKILPTGWTADRLSRRVCALIYALAASVENVSGSGWGGRWDDPAEGSGFGEPLALYTTYLGGGGVFRDAGTATLCTGCALRVRYRVTRGRMEVAA